MIKKSEFARRQRLGYDEVTRLRIEVTRGNDANQRPTTKEPVVGGHRSTATKRYILKKLLHLWDEMQSTMSQPSTIIN